MKSAAPPSRRARLALLFTPLALLIAGSLGCASTVRRLPGEVATPSGPATTACEKDSFIELAPTRTEDVDPVSKRSINHDDGLGLYRVGSRSPESIPGLRDELHSSPLVTKHAKKLGPYDDRRLLAAGLGVAGVVALGVGAVLFASSFERTGEGTAAEEQHIDSGRATIAGLVFAAGFGLAVAGIAVSPNSEDRAQADALRYTFRPPDDPEKDVIELIDAHNVGVRNHCKKSR